MKAKVLNILAAMPFEIVAWTMSYEKCNTLGDLAAKLCKCYIKEDADRIAYDLEYCYRSANA